MQAQRLGLRPVIPVVFALVAGLAGGSRLEGPALVKLWPTPRYDAAAPLQLAAGGATLELARAAVPRPLRIRKGQTLGGILGELGLGAPEVRGAVAALAEHVEVRRVPAGEVGTAYFDAGGQLLALELELRGRGRVRAERRAGLWVSDLREFRRWTETRQVTGEIESSLESAVRRSGAPPQLAYAMSDVLQWDLDFHRDLRRGDRFRVYYEEVYLDGEYHGLGQILALAYASRGGLLEAYRFGDGYYDADGRPLRKMFLRSPLPFSRVTSRFSHRRFHPVLKVHRPHYGVDYGAPRGTPVRVTANGVVTFAGRSGGAGNMVKVRHPNGYQSGYLHLSRFAKGIRAGKRVRQGDVIGYVGSTGLSTAPHLDYRVKKSGRWIDPLKLSNVPAEPIPAARLEAFFSERDALRRELGGGDWPAPAPRLAMATAP